MKIRTVLLIVEIKLHKPLLFIYRDFPFEKQIQAWDLTARPKYKLGDENLDFILGTHILSLASQNHVFGRPSLLFL